MKIIVSCLAVGLTFLAQPPVHAQPPDPTQPHSERYWRKRIALVHRGMKRSAVEEKFLPQRSEDHMQSYPHGHASVYAVDSEWTVKVPYDFHGFVADVKKNPHQLMHLYDNRVIGPIKLIHQPTEIDWQAFPPKP